MLEHGLGHGCVGYGFALFLISQISLERAVDLVSSLCSRTGVLCDEPIFAPLCLPRWLFSSLEMTFSASCWYEHLVCGIWWTPNRAIWQFLARFKKHAGHRSRYSSFGSRSPRALALLGSAAGQGQAVAIGCSRAGWAAGALALP